VSDDKRAPDALPIARAESAPTVAEELLPKRRPGRPKGSRGKDRVATAARILAGADPIGFRIKALKTGFILVGVEGSRKRVRTPLTKEEMLHLASELENKLLPNLRSVEVTGMETTHNTLLLGAMDGMGESQLHALVSALKDAEQSRAEAIDVTPEDANNTAVVQTIPRWSSR
jgi:hypothetical protein